MGEPLAFSVVITTRNRPRQLDNLLSALRLLDFPRDRFEVVVVDDGSDAPLDSVVSPYRAELCLKLIRNKYGGPARGRNTGVQAAQATYLAFIDDDCIPQSDWLNLMEMALDSNPGAMIGGKTLNGLPANAYSAASQFILNMVYAFYNQDPSDARFFATNNMALPRKGFLEIGGFDEDYVRAAGEDRDLCDRWKHAGFPMIYEPAAGVNHFHSLSLFSFCRQHFIYGRGAIQFHSKAAERCSGRLRNHLGFHRHLRSWFMRAWRIEPPRSGLKLIALFVAGQAMNAAGFFYGRVRG